MCDFLDKVPNDGLVMTQNHLGLPLSNRDVIGLKNSPLDVLTINPKYIVFDLRDGQNPNNYFPTNEVDFRVTINTLLEENHYQILYNQSDRFILKKSSPE